MASAVKGDTKIASTWIGDCAVVARQMMNLSSSFDHRVVDGALAAAFVQAVRERLEHPAMLFAEQTQACAVDSREFSS